MLQIDSSIFLQNINMLTCQLFLLFEKSTTYWDNPRTLEIMLFSNIYLSCQVAVKKPDDYLSLAKISPSLVDIKICHYESKSK